MLKSMHIVLRNGRFSIAQLGCFLKTIKKIHVKKYLISRLAGKNRCGAQ